MPLAAVTDRYRELGFRVIEGGKSGKCIVLKSLAVAEIFGVQHAHVMRDIREYQGKMPPNLEASFAEHCRESTYLDAYRREAPCYDLTKVGVVAIAAKYDAALRFLLALAFDALESGDNSQSIIIGQINARIRELRSLASGQDELKLDVVSPPLADDDDLDDATARGMWHHESPLNDNAPALNNIARLDRWTDTGWPIRRRHGTDGNVLMVWITPDDGLSTKKWWIPGPTGKYVLFCFNNPFPPIDVVLRTYDTLGPGPFAPVGKATLKHWLA